MMIAGRCVENESGVGVQVWFAGGWKNSEAIMDRVKISGNRRLKDAALVVAAVVLFSGCHPTPQGLGRRSAVRRHKVFVLKTITPERARAYLSELGLNRPRGLRSPWK